MLIVQSLIAVLMLSCTYVVVTARNLVYAVFFLILVYLGGMLFLILLDAEFVAIILLMVYVGAIAILFLFVVMTLNVSLLHSVLRSHLVVRSLGGFVGLAEIFLAFVVFVAVLFNDLDVLHFFDVSFNLPSLWTDVERLSFSLYVDYWILVAYAGIILLMVMVGVILLTIAGPRTSREQSMLRQHRKSFVASVSVK